ncbi:uncharacterized protein LOC132037514 [Lycium ferocissimum]|uniref:uncharacterized protein LOC132037514 n=1 Tax=Lycium ferocissimum TaxID=112874 RepID=UPI0028167A88|nr:uncharacterized protein LOC132037514 [Lycium ferocissimum]
MILCSQTNNDSVTDSNFGGGSSLLQFAVKEFQKLLSDKWIPCVDDISYDFVRQLAVERKCCLQLQGEAGRVLTDNDSKQLPLLQKLLDSDMLDLPSMVARVLPSNLQQSATKEYKQMHSDNLQSLVSFLESTESNMQLLGIKQLGQLFSEDMNKTAPANFIQLAYHLRANFYSQIL